jgi:ubiquinone/menaquinone biosynthesis C-methylase UbiE
MDNRRFPAAEAHRLDLPARRLWLPPVDVVVAMNVHSGQTVVDVGAGTGYFSLPLADAVGLHGKVYAVDAQNEMLALLRQKLDEAAILNVELIHAEAVSTGLPQCSCDLFFAANVWHEFEDRSAVLKEAARVLKVGGQIAILDWRTDAPPEPGPPVAHRLHSSNAVDVMRSYGFQNIAVARVGLYSWLVKGEMKR